MRAPFIDVDTVDFIPEGDEITAAPIDSREAVIATGALAVMTDNFRHQVFVHDQLTAVGLAVETDVVDADPPQLRGFDRATRPPARAEFPSSDRLNGPTGRCWRPAGRR